MSLRRKTWNEYAADFSAEVLNVVGHDTEGLIAGEIDRYCPTLSTAPIVGDFGCGVGWGVPLLAPNARHVHALDIADSFLDVAKTLPFQNVTYRQWDLSRRKLPPVPGLDLVLSLQVLITGDDKVRAGIVRTFAKVLKPGGRLIVSVPSLESQLWVYHNTYKHAGQSKAAATRKSIRSEAGRLDQGLVRLHDFETKFHLRDEIESVLTDVGFRILNCQRLNYCWSEELLPAKWNAAPPWNWLVTAEL